MAWKRKAEQYESNRQRHDRNLRKDPSRKQELDRKLCAEMLAKIVTDMCWCGSTAEEAANGIFTYFDGVTKSEAKQVSALAAYLMKSGIFNALNKVAR